MRRLVMLLPDFVIRLAVDTGGGRFHVEWDPQAPVTPLGQLVFFAQFPAVGPLFADWVRDCPLRYQSISPFNRNPGKRHGAGRRRDR